MGLAVFVFLLISATVVGGWAAVTYLPGYIEGRRLSQRLREVSTTPAVDLAEGAAPVVRRDEAGPLPGLDRIVSGTGAGSWLKRLIQQSGIKTSPSAVMMMCVLAAVLFGFVCAMFVRQPLVAPVAAIFGGFAPIGFLLHRRGSRLKRFAEQFPEALDLLSRAIRAGHALQTALGMVADELPQPVGPEFKKVFDQQNFGLPLREALDALAVRVPILDVRFFVTAVLIQRDTGGNLSEILDNLAHVVRERFKIRRQIRVHTAHGRFTAYVLLALPAALAVALSFINPDHMQLLFREHMGQMMLGGTIVLQTIGYIWIRQVIKIEV